MTKDTKQTNPRQELDNVMSAPRVMRPAGLVVALVGAEPAAAQPGRFWVPNRIRVIFRPGAIEVPLPVERFDLACGQPEASQDGVTVHGVPIRNVKLHEPPAGKYVAEALAREIAVCSDSLAEVLRTGSCADCALY